MYCTIGGTMVQNRVHSKSRHVRNALRPIAERRVRVPFRPVLNDSFTTGDLNTRAYSS